jgi:hypothetical protein
MVDKHSIFSFDPFPRKETPAIFKINGTMIRVQVFLCLCRNRAMGVACF